ncbi:hypothetical protein FGG66_gp41 [Corynebacterium phage phi674]|uniref:Uncharacterized protein n=1 Tax=Corynebacterium phage phi674 TaxID=2052822 RepID=A0A2H4PJ05_9CAUD|nr:hypothetical protein FGG66_gp41 [Corynebacterium phage phi674]ATW62959.1 hypothetical protein phi674_gp41 [Corynebacterium phage phi674]
MSWTCGNISVHPSTTMCWVITLCDWSSRVIISPNFVVPSKSLPTPDQMVHTNKGKVGRWYPEGFIIVADYAGVELLPHAGSASMKAGSKVNTTELVAALAAAHQWHTHWSAKVGKK